MVLNPIELEKLHREILIASSKVTCPINVHLSYSRWGTPSALASRALESSGASEHGVLIWIEPRNQRITLAYGKFWQDRLAQAQKDQWMMKLQDLFQSTHLSVAVQLAVEWIAEKMTEHPEVRRITDDESADANL